MIGAVLKTEVQRGLRDRALPILLVIFALLTAYASWSGKSIASAHAAAAAAVVQGSVDQRAERRAEFERVEDGEALSRGATLPYAQVDYIAQPHAPGAAISVSQIESFPRVARVTSITETHGIFDEFSGSTTNPESLAVGPFDLAFLIVFLLPLFVLASSFDVWTGERERGIARQILAEPAAPVSLLGGKLAARLLLTVLPLAVIAGIGAAIIGGPATAASVFLLTGLYGGFWIGVAGLINVIVRQPTEAAIAAGASWLALVLLLPALLAALVDAVAPAPSRAALANETRTVLVDTQARGDDVLSSYLSQHPTATSELQVLSEGARQYYAVQLAADAVTAPVTKAHRENEARRLSLANQMRFLSPATMAQDALDRLAGFDPQRALVFRDQAYAHLVDMRDFVTPRLLNDSVLTASDYDEMPVFTFEEPKPTSAQTLNLLGLLILSALLLLASLGMAKRLRRI